MYISGFSRTSVNNRASRGEVMTLTESHYHRDFPRPDLVPNICHFAIKNEQILLKMVYIVPNLLVLHFGENFMKIRTKIPELQMHEILHKNVNENMFPYTFLCKFLWWAIKATNMLQFDTANYLHVFKPFKMAVSFKLHQVFQIFMVLVIVFPNATGSWPRL